VISSANIVISPHIRHFHWYHLISSYWCFSVLDRPTICRVDAFSIRCIKRLDCWDVLHNDTLHELFGCCTDSEILSRLYSHGQTKQRNRTANRLFHKDDMQCIERDKQKFHEDFDHASNLNDHLRILSTLHYGTKIDPTKDCHRIVQATAALVAKSNRADCDYRLFEDRTRMSGSKWNENSERLAICISNIPFLIWSPMSLLRVRRFQSPVGCPIQYLVSSVLTNCPMLATYLIEIYSMIVVYPKTIKLPARMPSSLLCDMRDPFAQYHQLLHISFLETHSWRINLDKVWVSFAKILLSHPEACDALWWRRFSSRKRFSEKL
jgi:hypothetical protein